MRYYLRALSCAIATAFQNDDWSAVDRIEKHNDSIMNRMFCDLLDEKADYAFIRQANGNFVSYTRSAKHNHTIQKTVFWIKDGEYVPLSDQQYRTFADMRRDGYPNGYYIYIRYI